MTNQNILDRLIKNAEILSNKRAYGFYNEEAHLICETTHSELLNRVFDIACKLKMQGLKPGDLALLLYDSNLDYIYALLGCMYAGVIAIPSYPPATTMLSEKMHAIIDKTNPKVILSTNNLHKQIKKTMRFQFLNQLNRLQIPVFQTSFKKLPWLITDKNIDLNLTIDPVLNNADIAYLQYSSGSTGTPKGVIVKHKNIMANLANLYQASEMSEDQILLGWIPPYHDMGLVGLILLNIYSGATNYLSSPLVFLKNPASWIKAISKFRGNITAAPNFAFSLCANKIPDSQLNEIDLSCLKIAVSASEQVDIKELELFYEKFKSYGLTSPNVFCPTYGCAETMLLACGNPPSKPNITVFLDKSEFSKNKVKIVKDAKDALPFVGCGSSKETLIIVEPHKLEPLQEREIGEIWLHGESIADGYWNDEENTLKNFNASLPNDTKKYFRTGDLGFIHEGQVFICGRIKELIILHGYNYYPHDIERLIRNTSNAIRPGSIVAFSISENSEEKLVVLFSTKHPVDKHKVQNIFSKIYSTLHIEGIALSHLALVPRSQILKTSSGKLRRTACQDAFLNNKIKALHQVSYAAKNNKLTNENPADATIHRTIIRMILTQSIKRDMHSWPNAKTLSTLNLDSITAMQIVQKLRLTYKHQFPAAFIYNFDTISKIENYIKDNALNINDFSACTTIKIAENYEV